MADDATRPSRAGRAAPGVAQAVPEVARAVVPAPASGRVRVGLVADTHIPEARAELWPEVLDAFAGVDLILHGGDIHDLSVLDALERLAPVHAARGNGEDGSGFRGAAPDDGRLAHAWLLDVGGCTVALTHDVPVPEVPPHLTVARWCERRFGSSADEIDVMVYGDTHVEALDLISGVLCVNPGSPTFPHNRSTQLGTVGFLEIEGGRARASIVQLTASGPVPFPGLDAVER